MACEHRQNLSVEPLYSAANSALRIAQRPLDVIEITRNVISLDRAPPVSHLDNPGLQVGKHRRNRRQLRRVIAGIRLLSSHAVVVSEVLRVCNLLGKPMGRPVPEKKRASASRRRRSLGDTGRRIPELVTILVGWRNPTSLSIRHTTSSAKYLTKLYGYLTILGNSTNCS
jgi:hypothetical protein